jgi:catechol-2,3-dioxygenase
MSGIGPADFPVRPDRRRVAVFLARGGYHHHLAANAWSRRGAGRRAEGRRGLVSVTFAGGLERPVTDPWGNRAVPA